MVETITLEQARRDFDRIVERVAASADEFVIAKNGHPLARIVPPQSEAANGVKRAPGTAHGELIVPDDLNDPLPREVEDLFYQ